MMRLVVLSFRMVGNANARGTCGIFTDGVLPFYPWRFWCAIFGHPPAHSAGRAAVPRSAHLSQAQNGARRISKRPPGPGRIVRSAEYDGVSDIVVENRE